MSEKDQTGIAGLVQDAFAKVLDAGKATKEDLVILGGEFAADRLPEFLGFFSRQVDAGMPWIMVETVDKFSVYKNPDFAALLSQDVFFVERLRIFGPAADLDLRRDGDEFLWHYLGSTKVMSSGFDAAFPSDNFWDFYPDITFRVVEESYLQWWEDEKRVAEHWVEPVRLEPETRWLKQRQYLYDGQVVFAQYLSFHR